MQAPTDFSDLEGNETTTSNDGKDSNVSWFKRAILWIGLACCLQFLVFAVVGVARGYSVQSWAPHWVMIVGIFLVMPFSRKHAMVSFLSSGLLILVALISTSQGQHQERGDELYEAGRYEDALAEYRQEIETWYLRLTFNYREASSMFGVAECHSQMEQFGKARETYVDMSVMFRGYYKERSEKELTDLDANLVKVAELKKRITEEEDDDTKASLLFDLALVYRELICLKKSVEQYEEIQSLDVREERKKQARRFAEKLQQG